MKIYLTLTLTLTHSCSLRPSTHPHIHSNLLSTYIHTYVRTYALRLPPSPSAFPSSRSRPPACTSTLHIPSHPIACIASHRSAANPTLSPAKKCDDTQTANGDSLSEERAGAVLGREGEGWLGVRVVQEGGRYSRSVLASSSEGGWGMGRGQRAARNRHRLGFGCGSCFGAIECILRRLHRDFTHIDSSAAAAKFAKIRETGLMPSLVPAS